MVLAARIDRGRELTSAKKKSRLRDFGDELRAHNPWFERGLLPAQLATFAYYERMFGAIRERAANTERASLKLWCLLDGLSRLRPSQLWVSGKIEKHEKTFQELLIHAQGESGEKFAAYAARLDRRKRNWGFRDVVSAILESKRDQGAITTAVLAYATFACLYLTKNEHAEEKESDNDQHDTRRWRPSVLRWLRKKQTSEMEKNGLFAELSQAKRTTVLTERFKFEERKLGQSLRMNTFYRLAFRPVVASMAGDE